VKNRWPGGKWIHIESSAIREVRYRERQRELHAHFADNPDLYIYEQFPRSKFRQFMNAKSKGKFMNKEIKPRHPFRKLADDQQ
jgi:hypothetical protein